MALSPEVVARMRAAGAAVAAGRPRGLRETIGRTLAELLRHRALDLRTDRRPGDR